MQVERFPKDMPDEMKKDLSSGSFFDKAEEFKQEKLEEYLAEDDVKAVHVFKATPQNLKFAELRKLYPCSNRKTLRKMMKHYDLGNGMLIRKY